MSQVAVVRLAELIKDATDAQIAENTARAGQIEASASLFIDTDLARIQSDKEQELADQALATSGSVVAELGEFESNVSASIALVIENPTAAVDSLKEIQAELESDKAELEGIEADASTELEASRSAFLDAFGEVSEFVLSFDGTYTPSDATVADSYNAL